MTGRRIVFVHRFAPTRRRRTAARACPKPSGPGGWTLDRCLNTVATPTGPNAFAGPGSSSRSWIWAGPVPERARGGICSGSSTATVSFDRSVPTSSTASCGGATCCSCRSRSSRACRSSRPAARACRTRSGGWRWLRPVAPARRPARRRRGLRVSRGEVGCDPQRRDAAAQDRGDPERRRRAGRGGRAAETANQIGIACIANLHPYKGHAVLLEAFALAERRLGPRRLHLELVGSGVEHARLVEQAERLGVTDGWRSSARSTTSRGGSGHRRSPCSRRSARLRCR